ncbi:phage tail protein [Petralouisia muris]|jgi:phage tail-like protein|uniref:Phage tail protein n=1 Tax=Petralouisia muris TaxID=3032872 RepID=A0AC61RXF3_9FIRM|nr:phage tail protein [Petralouisia muris]TGY96629.1 phage tail protein [Petralouisia muris]
MAAQDNLAKRTKFKVILNGMPLGFSKVSNISATMEFETVPEGGVNDRVHYLPKPRQSMDKLILEYGIASGELTRTTLTAGYELKKGIVIMVMPESGMVPTATYQANWGIVTKWEIDTLDAISSGLLIKKVEISHNGLTETINKFGI